MWKLDYFLRLQLRFVKVDMQNHTSIIFMEMDGNKIFKIHIYICIHIYFFYLWICREFNFTATLKRKKSHSKKSGLSLIYYPFLPPRGVSGESWSHTEQLHSRLFSWCRDSCRIASDTGKRWGSDPEQRLTEAVYKLTLHSSCMLFDQVSVSFFCFVFSVS